MPKNIQKTCWLAGDGHHDRTPHEAESRDDVFRYLMKSVLVARVLDPKRSIFINLGPSKL